MRLILTAPKRHNCHPKRLKNIITTSVSVHKLPTVTDYNKNNNSNKINIIQK